MKSIINIKGTEITVISKGKEDDFISLTDIAKYKNPDDPRFVIQNWMRTRFTIEFMGFWEVMHNPDFNRVEFEAVRNEAGSNSFVMTPTKWAELTHAIGVYSKAGRYGGTFAHKDIAFEFASWVSAEFKLYIIKDYQRLKEKETSPQALGWNLSRTAGFQCLENSAAIFPRSGRFRTMEHTDYTESSKGWKSQPFFFQGLEKTARNHDARFRQPALKVRCKDG
ncbi:MAG: KilA-N domain-containing protein [Kiritimatiellales bacterium]